MNKLIIKRDLYWKKRQEARENNEFVRATYFEGMIAGINEAIEEMKNEAV